MNICPRSTTHRAKLTFQGEEHEWSSFPLQHRPPRLGIRREYKCLDCGMTWRSFEPYKTTKKRKP
jgi:hypothetical protein